MRREHLGRRLARVQPVLSSVRPRDLPGALAAALRTGVRVESDGPTAAAKRWCREAATADPLAV